MHFLFVSCLKYYYTVLCSSLEKREVLFRVMCRRVLFHLFWIARWIISSWDVKPLMEHWTSHWLPLKQWPFYVCKAFFFWLTQFFKLCSNKVMDSVKGKEFLFLVPPRRVTVRQDDRNRRQIVAGEVTKLICLVHSSNPIAQLMWKFPDVDHSMMAFEEKRSNRS